MLLRELRTTGSLVTARRVGNAVHTVLVKEAPPLTRVEAWPPEVAICNGNLSDAQIIDAFERLRARNLRTLEQTDNTPALPAVTDVVHDPQTGTTSTSNNLLASCPGFYRESGPRRLRLHHRAVDRHEHDRARPRWPPSSAGPGPSTLPAQRCTWRSGSSSRRDSPGSSAGRARAR